MIDFSYKREGEKISLTLKLDTTKIGTFYRLTAILYALGLDILSGKIETIRDGDNTYSLDTLDVKSESTDANQLAAQLAILMDSVFSQNVSLEELLAKYRITYPKISKFFQEDVEFIFEDDKEKQMTCFYLEAGSGRGLLYHISRVLSENSINIVSGMIETDEVNGRAKDTFYLTDKNGKMFGGTQLAEELHQKIVTYKEPSA